jgi:hypothetical protein
MSLKTSLLLINGFSKVPDSAYAVYLSVYSPLSLYTTNFGYYFFWVPYLFWALLIHHFFFWVFWLLIILDITYFGYSLWVQYCLFTSYFGFQFFSVLVLGTTYSPLLLGNLLGETSTQQQSEEWGWGRERRRSAELCEPNLNGCVQCVAAIHQYVLHPRRSVH